MSISHAHAFDKWADFSRAPIGPPPAHTRFIVIACDCGAFDVFPAENFELCTPTFQLQLRRLMRALGFTHVAALDEARALVAAGGTHDCGEWPTPAGICALCERQL